MKGTETLSEAPPIGLFAFSGLRYHGLQSIGEGGRAMKATQGLVRLTTVVGVLFLFSAMLALTGHAEVPHQINCQGYLTDDLGNPLDGEYWMLFSIYDVPDGGIALWCSVSIDGETRSG